ncbi:hypothetical protein [Cellulomonas sp. Y8]|uniref:hypothetical protein n=1 Tax=Cellulomonas sp. Y8 TaxID=2591145 RepID=UPI001FEEB711|nr:hypothetical protein [Cellulomonas sp. Y8]
MNKPPRVGLRLTVLVPAGVAVLAGLDGALLLLGLPAPVRSARLEQVHGPLMVLGFVGTVVALERAVAVGGRRALLAPACLAAGALLLLSPAPVVAGAVALLGGTVGLCAIYAVVWRRQPSTALAVQALGAGLAVVAAGLWARGVAVPHLAPALAGFLVLTVAGERLELGRVGGLPRRAEDAVLGCAVAWWVAAVAGLLWPGPAHVALGAVLLVLVAVLVRHDVARRTVRGARLPRFMAVAMLGGYAWLAVAGAIWLAAGRVLSGPAYDAVLHAVFLGFVVSMLMAHAPVVLPAVVRRPLPYRPVMYAPLVLLHVTLALRLLVGDAHGQAWAVRAGGVGNVVALLSFLALAAGSVLLGPATRERAAGPAPAAANVATPAGAAS